MRTFSTLALLALPWLANAAQPPSFGNAIYASAQEAFQELLDAVPEESLKNALSGLKGWKDGVFESQHRGVQHVHETNPALATKIIVAAVHDLKKRQAKPSNSTAVPPPPSTSTPPPQQSSPTPSPVSSSKTSVIVSVTLTTTQNGPSVVTTSSVAPDTTTTSTTSQAQSVAPTVTNSVVVKTTTDSAGHTTVKTSAAIITHSSGQILTSTDAQGSTFITTYTPSAARISSVMLITTTGSDGKPSTVTSYTVVDATANPTATGKPGLQNGAGKQATAFGVAAACAGALALFL